MSDTGVGMSPEAAAIAFEPYFSTKETGVGLGLALVSRIVEGHGGTIALDSTPGQGTSVRLLLPVRAPASARAGRSAGSPRVKPRVLVVDDEAPQLEILRLILGSEGYDVVTAASGRAALAALRRQPFEVVLTDLKMPDLSGIALLEEILREQPAPASCS